LTRYIEDQEQPERQVEDRERGFDASQRMRPGHLVEVVQREVRSGEERAHRRADQEDADRAVDEQESLVGTRAQQVVRLLPVLIADRLDDEGEKDQDPHPVGPAETRRIELGKCREQGSAKEHQRGEREFPLASQRVDDELLFAVRARYLPEQRLPALDEVERQKQRSHDRDEDPPDLLQQRRAETADHVKLPPGRF
jgi:hypothetical protein